MSVKLFVDNFLNKLYNVYITYRNNHDLVNNLIISGPLQLCLNFAVSYLPSDSKTNIAINIFLPIFNNCSIVYIIWREYYNISKIEETFKTLSPEGKNQAKRLYFISVSKALMCYLHMIITTAIYVGKRGAYNQILQKIE